MKNQISEEETMHMAWIIHGDIQDIQLKKKSGLYEEVYDHPNATARAALSLDREANRMTGDKIAYYQMSEAKAEVFEAYSRGDIEDTKAALAKLGAIVIRLMVTVGRHEERMRICPFHHPDNTCGFLNKDDRTYDCVKLCFGGECPTHGRDGE